MSARSCPACQRELPEAILRALEQGTACPHCATRLKRTPRRAPAPAGDDYAGFQVSHTPPVTAQPSDEDSYRWFQTKAPAGTAAPAAAASLPKARSLFPLPAAAGPPGPTPSISGTPGPVRPEPAPVRPAQAPPAKSGAPAAASLDLPPPAAPVAPRRAPTLMGSAPPPAEKSPPSPAPAPPVRAPNVRPAQVEPPLAHKPSPSPAPPTPAPPVPAPSVRPAQAEPPRAALAMTAVLPTSGSALALAAPAMGFSSRSRRNMSIAAGTAMVTVLVAILVSHRAAERRAPIAGNPLAGARPAGDSTPLATSTDTSRASPTIQPARAAAAEPSAPAAGADLVRDAAETPTAAAHTKVRTKHRAAAHQRRSAKNGKRAKHARHERRNARQKEMASRAPPSSGDDAEARASYERGNALLFAGDATGAVAAYRKAVELAPADPIGYRGLGLAYEQQGGTGAAIRALRKYLKLAPGAADREIISRRIARLGQAARRP